MHYTLTKFYQKHEHLFLQLKFKLHKTKALQ